MRRSRHYERFELNRDRTNRQYNKHGPFTIALSGVPGSPEAESEVIGDAPNEHPDARLYGLHRMKAIRRADSRLVSIHHWMPCLDARNLPTSEVSAKTLMSFALQGRLPHPIYYLARSITLERYS
eukprot:IDg7970t1